MEVKVCTRCVMDNVADATISFENDGTCNYCNNALKSEKLVYFPNQEGANKLENIFNKIKEDGKGKKYDCMIGLSGGLDSAYVAYIAHKHGLRILAVHVDDGLDAPVTVENIKKICTTFNIDLISEKPNKDQFADLTRAFILAGLPEIAIPQDNVLFACLYKYAQKNNIKYFLSGENFTLECITQAGFDATDKVHILDVHKKFGRAKIDDKLPLYSILEKRLKYKYFHKIQFVKPLYFVDYNASKALSELSEACGYEYYGNKHWESLFTKFVQVYYLPNKFNIDKRKSHYSSMIVSGQMTRAEALEKLKLPQYNEVEMEKELGFILDYLELSRAEFDKVMNEPPRKHVEFKSSIINKLSVFILEQRKKKFGY